MDLEFPALRASQLYGMVREGVERVLARAVDDLAALTIREGRMWRLTARRMGWDYRAVARSAEGFGWQAEQWLAGSDLSREQALALKGSVDELKVAVRRVLEACERGVREGDGLEVFADFDGEGYGVLLGLLDQELAGDRAMMEFLREVVADGIPFVHTRAEFEDVRASYAGQAAIIAELSGAERRLRPKGMKRSANVREKLALLRRNEKAIGRLAERALAMYEH
ncbi:hypothetical protein [Hyphomicrobium sp. CS1BSMeth3]|uniref:hypothetical protein n=1 Tax=Hyphomicrobium sp. CS1BSMeth3 TaxID=1892844 RepID=UPI000930BD35|nr:hypothetical protein [Hyphomicrobium sp. CS1BSMeth3]